MTSPAEKLRRGEYPEFNSGPLQGAPPLPTFAPSAPVQEVRPQAAPVAVASPPKDIKVQILGSTPPKQKEVKKAKDSVSLAARQMYLMAAPSSISLANVSGFGQRLTPQQIGPMNVRPENILGGSIKGWHIGFSRSWRFISDTPDVGVKLGLYPFGEMGIDERTAGINVHELDRDNIDDRHGEFGLKADTGVQILVGRNSDGSTHLPVQVGRADADGTFTEIARFDTVNDRMGVGTVAPAEKIHSGGAILADTTVKLKDGTAHTTTIDSAATADHTSTLPNKTGTVAHLSDIPSTFAPSAITPVNTDKLIGRDTAGSGAAEEIGVTGGIEFNGSQQIQTSAFTGDVTKAAGGTALTIPNGTVTNAKQADMADSTIKGRAAGAGTGAPTDLSVAQVLAMLGIQQDLVFVETPADVPINSTSDTTVSTFGVTGVAAGDQIIVEGWFLIMQSTGGNRTYTLHLNFNGVFSYSIITAALVSSIANHHWFKFSAVCEIKSSSEAEAMFSMDGRLAAGIPSAAADTMAATHLGGKTWDDTTSDLTGTCTVTLNIKSDSALATQTLKLKNLTIRKVTPT